MQVESVCATLARLEQDYECAEWLPGGLQAVKALHDPAGVIAGLRAGEEGREGVRSFLERRKPSWSIVLDDDGD